MKLNHIGIILLSLLSIFGVYDIIGVDVWAAVIMGYTLTYFLVSITLFALSYYSKKKDTGRLKMLDILGIYISIISIIITIFYFIWDLIR